MANTNNTDTEKTFNENPKKVTINTIQRTALVERLCIDRYYTGDRIIPYDIDNLYPNKIKAIALRSGSTKSAIGTQSVFIRGDGYRGMDTIVNKDKQTGWDILRHISKSKSMFGGFALHFNFNVFGIIAEITPVPFEWLRWDRNIQKIVLNTDWAKRRQYVRDEKEYNPYNPENVLSEIESAGGIDKYGGQMLYCIDDWQEVYPIPEWDSVIDDAQFEAESKIYKISCIQNDYSLSGFFMYPKFLESEEEILEIKKDLRGDTGSANAGGIKVFSFNPMEEMKGYKPFHSIGRNNIDNLHKNQNTESVLNIYHAFRQPPILNGVSESGMFNKASFADAHDYYNNQTETERKDIEKEMTKIFQNSIWPMEVKIIPKKNLTNGTAID